MRRTRLVGRADISDVAVPGPGEALAGEGGDLGLIRNDGVDQPVRFGGGIDESVPPVMVDGDGTVTEGTYPQTSQLEGGYSVLELPSREAALAWAAKIAAACRCAQEVRAFQYDPES